MSHTSNDKDRNRKRTSASSGSNRSKSTSSGKGSEDRRQQQETSKRNSILIIILSVIVVISVVAGVIVNLGNKEPGNTQDTGTANSNVNVIENSNDLEQNKHQDVNELISNYRKAFKEGNTELLKQVYNSDQEINADILTATTKIIEDYQNTQYYTKRGLNTGEYVVFVYDELKLVDIKTLAPNLSVFYVKPADDGKLYIYRGDYNSATGAFKYDDATQAYINKLYQDQDVSELISEVNTRMDSACANDSDLMDFMQRVRSKTNVTVPAETEDESRSETETQTESETESGVDA